MMSYNVETSAWVYSYSLISALNAEHTKNDPALFMAQKQQQQQQQKMLKVYFSTR